MSLEKGTSRDGSREDGRLGVKWMGNGRSRRTGTKIVSSRNSRYANRG